MVAEAAKHFHPFDRSAQVDVDAKEAGVSLLRRDVVDLPEV
jgi:hypothetical protein